MGHGNNTTPTTAPRPPMRSGDDTLMKQYQILVDAYKSYFDLILKFILFSYAVTGAILSFYLSQSRQGIMRFGLFFPMIMNALFAWLSFEGASRKTIVSRSRTRHEST